MRGFVDKMKRLEQGGEVLSVSAIHGFMAGDVPDLGAKILVTTNADKARGDAVAEELGKELFSFRGKTRPELLSPDCALSLATAVPAVPVVIADVWDNPGGGVPGDSTIILSKMLERRVSNAALATIWDPVAVRTCFSAGEGARLTLRFGGKMSANGGAPLDEEVAVRRNRAQRGPVVRRQHRSLGGQRVDRRSWNRCHPEFRSQPGFQPRCIHVPRNRSDTEVPSCREVDKTTSTMHFSGIASEILYAAVDGLYPNDPKSTDYKNLTRKLWPIVEAPHD